MNCLAMTDQGNRRPAAAGRARRSAKTSIAILAEMPRQLRQMHLVGGKVSPSHESSKREKRNDEKRQQSAAGTKTTKSARQQGRHARRHAMVWDDIVSFVRLEMIRAEQEKRALAKLGKTLPSARYRGIQTNKTGDYHPRSHEALRLSGGDVGSEVNDMSPPRITRMTFCFDSNGCDHLSSTFEKATRLRSRAVSHPGRAATKTPSVVGRGGHKRYESAVHSEATATTYISSDDDDYDEESSLEYSDDNSDIERAAVASAAIPVKISGGGVAVSCAICLDCTDGADLASVSGCNHRFCFECIDRWAEKKSECPLCKEAFCWVASRTRVRWY